jgi:hypothetical protein
MHLQQPNIVDPLSLLHQGAEILFPLFFVETAFRDVPTDLPGIKLCIIRGVFIGALGHFQGAVQGVPNPDVEPVFDAVGKEIYRNQKQNEGRNEGETDKGHDEFGSDPGTDNPVAPFINQLDDVSHDQEDQQDDEDDVDVDEAEDEDVAGDGQDGFLTGKMGLQKGEQDDDDNRDDNEDALPLPAAEFPAV